MRALRPFQAFPLPFAILAVLAIAALPASCKRAPKEDGDSDWQTFTGRSLLSDEITTGTVLARTPVLAPLASDAFRATTFESRARAAYPSARGGAVQREAFARAEARRSALRAIGEQVLVHQPRGSSSNVSLIFESVPGAREVLESALESSASVGYTADPDSGNVEARATLAGADILRHILAAQIESLRAEQPPDSAPIPPEERKAAAESAALESARSAARAAVMDIQTNLGGMREIIETHPEAAAELDAWIGSLQPRSVIHKPAGVCETSVRIDMHRAFAIIKKFTAPLPPPPPPPRKKSSSGTDKPE